MIEKYNYNKNVKDFKNLYNKPDEVDIDNNQRSIEKGSSSSPTFCSTLLKINDIDDKIGDQFLNLTIFETLNQILNHVESLEAASNYKIPTCIGKALARVEIGFSDKFDVFSGTSLQSDPKLIFNYFMNKNNWPDDFCYSNSDNINDIICAAQIFSRIKAASESSVDPVTNNITFKDIYGVFDKNQMYNYYSIANNWKNFCTQQSSVNSNLAAEIFSRVLLTENDSNKIDIYSNIPVKGDMSLYNYYATPRVWKDFKPNSFVFEDMTVLCLGKVVSRVISNNEIKLDPFSGFPVGKSDSIEIYNFYSNPENWNNFCHI